jgi:hypothetical protein
LLRWASSSAGRAPRSQRGGRRFDPGLVHQTTLLCESRMLRPAFGVMRPKELVFILANSASRGIREPSVVDSIRKLRESDLPPQPFSIPRAGRSMIGVAVEARAPTALALQRVPRFRPSGFTSGLPLIVRDRFDAKPVDHWLQADFPVLIPVCIQTNLWSRGVTRWFRCSLSVADSFVCRCLTSCTMLPSSHPAHRTGYADFPLPALGERVTMSPTGECASVC